MVSNMMRPYSVSIEAIAGGTEPMFAISKESPHWQQISKFLKKCWFEGATSMDIISSKLFICIQMVYSNQRLGYFAPVWEYISCIVWRLQLALGPDEIYTIFEGSRRNGFCARCVLILEFFKKFSSFVDRSTTLVLVEISNGNNFYSNFSSQTHTNICFQISMTFQNSFILE